MLAETVVFITGVAVFYIFKHDINKCVNLNCCYYNGSTFHIEFLFLPAHPDWYVCSFCLDLFDISNTSKTDHDQRCSKCCYGELGCLLIYNYSKHILASTGLYLLTYLAIYTYCINAIFRWDKSFSAGRHKKT